MPELPEVEALVRALDQRTAGRRIQRLKLYSIAVLKTFEPPPQSLEGVQIGHWSRRGKHLVCATRGPALVIHLARAGWVRWQETIADASPRLRGPLAAQLILEGTAGLNITEQGTEKRLAIWLAQDPAQVPSIARLGIDALDPTLDMVRLRDAFGGERRPLKSVLADQSVIAGIGNAYSDEILQAAGLSPYAHAGRLTDEALTRLHNALRDTLAAAVERAARSDPDQMRGDKKAALRIHGQDGQPCPTCGNSIRSVYLGSRSFQYCATCQTGGKPLADRRLSRLLR